MKRYTSGLILLLGLNSAFAQDFNSDLKKLDSQIEIAYESKKISETEFEELKKEKEVIQESVEKAKADDVVTQDEKNKIYTKIIRSKKRLVKYKNKSEIN